MRECKDMDRIHMNEGHSPVAGFCKHATEKWDMIKQGYFLAQLGY